MGWKMKDQKRNLIELLQLINDNPSLPIIPIVESDVVENSEFDLWIAGWGNSNIDEYLIMPNTCERGVAIKSEDQIYDDLLCYLPKGEFKKLPDTITDEELRPYWEKLPWKRAIIVYIGSPDWTAL